MKRTCILKLLCLVMLLDISVHLDAQINQIQEIFCPGNASGKLGVVSPSFGVGPYTYLWSTGATSQSIAGLAAGNYSVTITDNLGVSQSFSYTLVDPPMITTLPSIVDNSSWPNNNGTITINGSGGTGWLVYMLVDSTSTIQHIDPDGIFDNLASGTYYTTTLDMNQCPHKDTLRIKEFASVVLDSTVDYTACYASRATIGIRPQSSAVPIVLNFGDSIITVIDRVLGRYVLSNLDTVDVINYDALPGFHLVEVSDALHKGARFAWMVDSVSAPISLSWTKDDVVCYQGNTGTLALLPDGSYGDFSYSISGPSGFTSTSSSLSGLSTGIYHVLIEDSNDKDDTHCQLQQDIEISQPHEPLHIVFDQAIQPRCRFTADGSIRIRTIEGAEGTISYLWSDGQTANEATSLRSGNYSVDIVDGNGCIAQDSLRLLPGNTCIYNIVTPNGDGYNDYLDLTDLCKDMQMEAIVVDQWGKTVGQLSESSPRWNPKDLTYLPTGTSSTFTVFFKLFENGNLYGQDGVSFSVIFEQK